MDLENSYESDGREKGDYLRIISTHLDILTVDKLSLIHILILSIIFLFLTNIFIFLTNILVKKKKKCYNVLEQEMEGLL